MAKAKVLTVKGAWKKFLETLEDGYDEKKALNMLRDSLVAEGYKGLKKVI